MKVLVDWLAALLLLPVVSANHRDILQEGVAALRYRISKSHYHEPKIPELWSILPPQPLMFQATSDSIRDSLMMRGLESPY